MGFLFYAWESNLRTGGAGNEPRPGVEPWGMSSTLGQGICPSPNHLSNFKFRANPSLRRRGSVEGSGTGTIGMVSLESLSKHRERWQNDCEEET